MPARIPRSGALLFCAAWIVAAAPAAAQSNPTSAASAGSAPSGPPPGGRPPGPPPKAVQACAGKGAGTACSFSGREGRTMAGTCAVGKAPPVTAGTCASADSSETGAASAAATLACRPAQPSGHAGPGARQQQ